MKSIKIIVSIIVFSLGIFLGYAIANAYAIWYKNGFDPVPATVYVYSGLSSSYSSAVHNACVAWNNVGVGSLVYRSSSTHSNKKFPYNNSRNDITTGSRGTNTYVMRAIKVRYSDIFSELYEVDIDVNLSQPFSTTGSSSSLDFQSCITHELGHLLGLNDVTSSSKSSATMYYKISKGSTIARSLSTDDKNGIKYIYD